MRKGVYFGVEDFKVWKLLRWVDDVLWVVDWEDVDDELFVEGEEWDYEGLECDDVRDEDDFESFGISILCLFMVFLVCFNVFFIIFMVYMFWFWWWEGELLLVDRLRFNFRLDLFLLEEIGNGGCGLFVLFRFMVLWLLSCRFYSCLLVEKDSSCVGLLLLDDFEEVDVCKFFLWSVFDFLLLRNLWVRG